jgi:hypothetical protein
MTSIPIPEDIWGNNYWFDLDYHCYQENPGCEGLPDDTQVTVVYSPGPNGSDRNVYDNDNIIKILCIPTNP